MHSEHCVCLCLCTTAQEASDYGLVQLVRLSIQTGGAGQVGALIAAHTPLADKCGLAGCMFLRWTDTVGLVEVRTKLYV